MKSNWIFGHEAEYEYGHGFGTHENQRMFAQEGVIGIIIYDTPRDGSGELFAKIDDRPDVLPIIIDEQFLPNITVGLKYRIFGNLVHGGHKGYLVTLRVTGIQRLP